MTNATTRPTFVERIASAVRYPLQPGALSTNVAIAVAHLVTLLPLGFILDLLVWVAFFKYVFEVLRWSANGRDEAPEISFTVGDGIARYAVLLLVLLELALIFLTLYFGASTALLFGLLMTLATPAMMMILALDEGPMRALNPLAWLSIAARIGAPYLSLVAFFCAALVVQSVAAAAIAHVLPSLFATPLVYFVVNHLMIANFHLIGRVIEEHADDLGYSGHIELQDAMPAADSSQTTIAAARQRAASGDTQGATDLLREEIRSQPEAIALHLEYRRLLRARNDTAALATHARSFIPVLLRHEQDPRAVDVAREAQQHDPAFALDEAADITRLASAAAAAGQTQVALGLLRGFHKRFPGHTDVVQNYLLAARLLAERMNKEASARALLLQIKLDHPEDVAIGEVDAYLAFLDKVAAKALPGSAAP